MGLSKADSVSLGATQGRGVEGYLSVTGYPALSEPAAEWHTEKNILACLIRTSPSPNLIRGACRNAGDELAASLACAELGRRLRARIEACGPTRTEKASPPARTIVGN